MKLGFFVLVVIQEVRLPIHKKKLSKHGTGGLTMSEVEQYKLYDKNKPNVVAVNCYNFYSTAKFQCKMFGLENWILSSEVQPNWFWRKMQYLCFGNKWEEIK